MPKYPPLKVIRHVSFDGGKSYKLWDDCTEQERQAVSVVSLQERCRIWSGVTRRSGISFAKRQELSTLSG